MKYRWYYKIPLFGLLGILALIGFGYLVMFLWNQLVPCSLSRTRRNFLAGYRPFCAGQDPAAWLQSSPGPSLEQRPVSILEVTDGRERWHP